MRFATCPLAKSSFGSPTRPALDPRLEKTQNLVSTNVPEVIEPLRASCNGIGMVMVKGAMSTAREAVRGLRYVQGLHAVGARLFILGGSPYMRRLSNLWEP